MAPMQQQMSDRGGFMPWSAKLTALLASCLAMAAVSPPAAGAGPAGKPSEQEKNELIERIKRVTQGVDEMPAEEPEDVTGPTWVTSLYGGAGFIAVNGAAFDIEGRLLIATHEFGGPQYASVAAWDVTDPSTAPTGPDWEIPPASPGASPGFPSEIGQSIAVTFDGEIYFATRAFDGPDNTATVRKLLAESGGVIPSFFAEFPAGQYTETTVMTTPDGAPIVVMDDPNREAPVAGPRAYRLDPFTGIPVWSWETAGRGLWADVGSQMGAVNDRGDVFIAVASEPYNGVAGSVVLHKINGASGREAWTQPAALFNKSDTLSMSRTVVLPDSTGGAVVVSGTQFSPTSGEGTLFVTRIDAEGNRVWQYEADQVPSGYGADAGSELTASWGVLDDDDNAYVLFYAGRVSPGVMKLTPDAPLPGQPKAPVWVEYQDLAFGTGGSQSLGRIEIGRGIKGVYASGSRGRADWIARLDRETGDPDWEVQTTTSGEEGFPGFNLAIDGGGGVFPIGLYRDPGDISSSDFVLLKFKQPTPDEETMPMACPTFSIEDRSIWAPGVGLLEKSDEFDVLPAEVRDIEFPIGGTVDLSFFGLGEWGAELDFDFFFDPRIGYRAEINGGSVDIYMPTDITWVVPPEIMNIPGTNVEITSSYEVDPAARLNTCFSPTVDAGLTGSLDASAEIDLSASAGPFGSVNEELLDESTSLPQQYLPSLSLQWWNDFLGFTFSGEWNEYSDNLFRVKFRAPRLEAQAAYDPLTRSFTATPTDTSDPDFKTNRFFIASANITSILSEIISKITGVPIVTSFAYTVSLMDISLTLSAALFQFFIDMNVDLEQEIKVDALTPMVAYEFRDYAGNQVFPVLTDPPGASHPLVLPVGTPFAFEMVAQPPDLPGGIDRAPEVFITPTVFVESQMSNMTELDFVPGYTFETLSLGASGNYKSIELFSADTTLGVLQDDFASIGGLELFPNSFFPDPWAMNMPRGVNTATGARGIKLPQIVVTGPVVGKPTLVGASRSKLDMFIYDQTSPSVGAFNGVVNRTSRMLMYGRDFFPTNSSDPTLRPRVMISHHGRTEALAFTRLNSETLLVELPGRLRVLPGVARLWVETDRGCSETIDLPIEYPVPLLDAVNPNLWAADPDLNTIPIQVIDKKTLLGADTFITRRDYYILMRDTLWNASTAGGLSAIEYYPDFGFDQLPQFPAVYFGGMPLARFAQPVDNGIYNLRLSEANFDRPQSVPVFICNPGPGGGVSETLDLTIAAPLPVLARMEPSRIEPGGLELPFTQDGTFTLIVRGPEHVPTFPGFEEPKYGNFNADSVVHFGGEYDAASNAMIGGFELATEYVDSSELRADVPIQLVQHPGSHHIRVFTPDNGTEYFEELWVDADFDGEPDRFTDTDGDGVPDDLAFQGFLPSGGASAPLLLRVEYKAPVIHMLSQSESVQDNPFLDPANAPMLPFYNLSVFGEYFRDGAEVLVDGSPRETEFVSRQMVRCRMLASDVATPGVRQIAVQNPGADGDRTEALEFLVTPDSSRTPQLHARSP